MKYKVFIISIFLLYVSYPRLIHAFEYCKVKKWNIGWYFDLLPFLVVLTEAFNK